jgi:hypothetical protein
MENPTSGVQSAFTSAWTQPYWNKQLMINYILALSMYYWWGIVLYAKSVLSSFKPGLHTLLLWWLEPTQQQSLSSWFWKYLIPGSGRNCECSGRECNRFRVLKVYDEYRADLIENVVVLYFHKSSAGELAIDRISIYAMPVRFQRIYQRAGRIRDMRNRGSNMKTPLQERVTEQHQWKFIPSWRYGAVTRYSMFKSRI